DALPEIWAYGLRNVWRFSFDVETGALWAADIGQYLWEEVDLIERGANYGWNTHEASTDFAKGVELAPPAPHTPPVAEYGRGDGISITGGHVYRGSRYPELDGLYFYGDYVSGNLWSLTWGDAGGYEVQLERRTGRSIASFGEDDAGELYVLSFDGGIYRIVPSDEPADSLADWPQLLSETGLFASVADARPAAHVMPFEVNAPFWSDGAEKQRYFALPAGEAFDYTHSGTWGIPVGTTLIKSFRIESRARRPYLETRLIKRTTSGWEAATYLWDDRNTDATLAPEGRQFELYQPGGAISTWHAPSASECASCHVEAAGYALGITTAQLNRDSQLEDWIAAGALRVPADFDALTAAAFCAPTDEEAPLETRARTWLDVNCAMCHYPDGPGNAAIDLRFDTYLEETGLVDGDVSQGNLGFTGASMVKPGDPQRSILWQRVRTRGDGSMPNVASNVVDEAGVQLLGQWIESLQE
ncbi:MAG: putative repeat protein (TIGR03806 family), partial [Planctomycetota bacterium]